MNAELIFLISHNIAHSLHFIKIPFLLELLLQNDHDIFHNSY